MSKVDDLVRSGLERHQAGRRGEAEALYLKALARQPSHAAANHLLGVLLLQSGRASEAIPRLERAVKMNRSAEYLGNLGTALNAAGRPAEAVAAFDEALRLQPASPGVLNNRGMALKALYRHDEAVVSYRKAIEFLPAEAGFHRNLGNVLGELGDWHGAETAYRAALQRRPGFPNAATGLCNALLALNKADSAIREMADLAAHFPQESELHRALGHALWQSGNPERAAAAYRAAIAANPLDVEAHRLLGAIVARSGKDEEVLAVERLLENQSLTDNQRIQLEFTLGQACEDMGEGEAALAHYQAANRLVRAASPYDLDGALAEIEAIMQSFADLPDADLPPLEPPTGPIFLVGLPRSGKTTVEHLLARHFGIFPAGELGTLGIVATAISNRGNRVTGTAMTRDEANSLGNRYLAMAAALAGGGRVVDTMPNNFRLVGLIRQAMPQSRVLFCHRKPRAHVAALYSKYYAQSGNGYAADLADAVAFHAASDTLRAFWARRFPGFMQSVEATDLREIDAILQLPPLDAAGPVRESEPRLGLDLAASTTGRTPLLQAVERHLAAAGLAG